MRHWFRSWLAKFQVSRQVSALEARCLAAREANEHAQAALRQRQIEFDATVEGLDKTIASVRREFAAAERAQRKYEDALSAVRAELEVANDITIPTLVASHKLILGRIDADTAIQVRKQVAALPTRDD